MFSVLLTCLVVVSIIMVAVILLQRSEGSGMSGSQAASMFGGALTGASAGNFFTKLTAWLATIFFVICIALAFVVSRQGAKIAESDVRQELVKDVPVLPGSPISEEIANENGIEEVTSDSVPVPSVPTVPEN